MPIGAISRQSVLKALEEYDSLGEAAFLERYGFREARSYLLVHEGKSYPSKAIAGVAHQYESGQALKPSQFSGDRRHAVAWLERAGFTVIEPPRTFLHRIGDVRPTQRGGDDALLRSLLLLWALGQAHRAAPRLQHWSTIHPALAPMLKRYAGIESSADGARYPFWNLARDELWTITPAEELELTGRNRVPTLASLDRVNPAGGLLEDDYALIRSRPEIAAEAAAGLLLRFFYPLPEDLLIDLGLQELLGNHWADALRPIPGEQFKDRSAIWGSYGGQKQAGIGYLADGILSVFSDDKGPYADGRLPDLNWIAYVGDGLSGDQQLVDGNKMLEEYQYARRPLRYWHRPFQQHFTFETWAVIVRRQRRWGRGDDGEWRREYVWILAPVPSPLRESWPTEVIEALESDTHDTVDETGDCLPDDVVPPGQRKLPFDGAAYRRLSAAAERSTERRGRATRQTMIERLLRNASARAAVIGRSGGTCENPQCAGHPSELTASGEPILQVDHVHDLAKGGADLPWNMIALCPNCHALKTYGANREALRRVLQKTAQARHEAAQVSQT